MDPNIDLNVAAIGRERDETGRVRDKKMGRIREGRPAERTRGRSLVIRSSSHNGARAATAGQTLRFSERGKGGRREKDEEERMLALNGHLVRD